ncbi:hypothetical protein DPMN_103729 [Dreissena polymorpha]|uniref:Uncharacterized protein n=1 Tax=Dreissena polymorpha TaxID=45954 RepID=A0A9D4H8L2_DREPO|nr:hypothetical protein DPMN_103729 [Dreissena polymorpha]
MLSTHECHHGVEQCQVGGADGYELLQGGQLTLRGVGSTLIHTLYEEGQETVLHQYISKLVYYCLKAELKPTSLRLSNAMNYILGHRLWFRRGDTYQP